MLVRNLMTQNPRSCHTNDHLAAVAGVMWETDCGAVPIVDDHGRIAGIVTDRDVCMAAYTQGQPLWCIGVGVAMARDVITCRADDDVDAAEQAMRHARIRRLPVVDEDRRLVGMLSLNDLAREAVNNGHTGAPRTSDVTRTLAAICEPRFQIARAPGQEASS
jgi:predicted transcriptional regulator